MKQCILSLCLVFSLATLFTTTARAERPAMESILETLREAKTSSDPLPLLEKAQKEYKKFRTGVGGSTAGRNRANNAATHEHKEVALKKLQEAIDEAKAGQNPSEKISAALAEIHSSDEFKH